MAILNSGTTRFPLVIAAVSSFLSLMAVFCDGFPATMTLERAFPMNGDVELGELRARDRARHGRMLQSTTGGVVDFPVDGTFNPFLVGLYYTKVQLGNPPKEFYVQIDTGSDVLWVSCSSCDGCPSKSGLKIPLNAFDPKSSSSASELSCSDRRCVDGRGSRDSTCSSPNNVCTYSFLYGDGSNTSGYYVSDILHFDKVIGESTTTNSSAPIVFGCSTSVSGELTRTERAVGGIFGFGQQSLSVISQLSSQGITPNVFSHCLKGDDNGGGILVLGEIVEPNMVYSPLVPAQPHYNLNLESISVNGQKLDIDSSVFATSNDGGGTIIDSGTTLAYLTAQAYDLFVPAVDGAVSQSVQRVPIQGNMCYVVTSSVENEFPQVALNFEKASMVLSPQNYLLKRGTAGGSDIWCFGIMGIEQDMSIFGDIVLKDKIVVYDIAKQRIGWTDYDCSKSVNVSTSSSGNTETVSPGESGFKSSSPGTLPEKSRIWIALIAIIYTSILSSYAFL